MKKDTAIIIGASIILVLGIISIVISEFESISKFISIPKIDHTLRSDDKGFPEAITSGPFTLTKSQYKIYENIFYIVDGLNENEKGTIRFFVPDGREYRTTSYDGSQKSAFNLYFRPDTSYLTQFCVQEEFVGEWTITFDNNAYPPLKFKILNEHLNGPDHRLDDAC